MEDKKPLITIHVSGGMVQDVYTSLETDVEVEILDFDDYGELSDEEREDLSNSLERVAKDHRHIY